MCDVAFSCDDNGSPFLQVAVWSLLAHYKGAEPLRVNVFEGWGGHSAEHKAELQAIVEGLDDAKRKEVEKAGGQRKGSFEKNIAHHCPPPPPFYSLRYVDIEPFVAPYADLILNREKSRWNVFTWTPIFTPEALPDATGNVIHFDIDMLFNADVSPLFELDLNRGEGQEEDQRSKVEGLEEGQGSKVEGLEEGQGERSRSTADDKFNCLTSDLGPLTSSPTSGLGPRTSFRSYLIACCHEYDKYGDNAGRVVWEKGILPPDVERYFNTGVLVFNAEACRAERTWEKIISWYKDHYDIADRIEQDAWNALYHDRMLPLPVKWNFHDRAIKNYAKWDVNAKYWLGNPPRECLKAALDPAILHFWGPKKPWKVSHRPYRKLYHAAMRAVGQKMPREPLLATYYDFVNVLNLKRIRRKHDRIPVA